MPERWDVCAVVLSKDHLLLQFNIDSIGAVCIFEFKVIGNPAFYSVRYESTVYAVYIATVTPPV